MEEYIKNSILVVDDEKSNLMFLNNLLCDDYSVFVAKEGHEALRRAHELLPDLILLDIIMPGINGYEVLAELKASEMTQDIPVIFISGLNSEDDEKRGLTLDAADYITKPFNAVIVRKRVDNQIRIINQLRTIESLSMTDSLTGIDNRRSFDQRLDVEWLRAIRNKMPISLLMIDIDHFKEYNDTYGHPQGDVVLVTLAKILTLTLKRSVDFAARWGGEEFAVVLPGTGIKGALVVADLISANCRRTIIPCTDGTPTSVTISIGVFSQTPEPDDTVADYVANVDTALYNAKKMGRDRVFCF